MSTQPANINTSQFVSVRVHLTDVNAQQHDIKLQVQQYELSDHSSWLNSYQTIYKEIARYVNNGWHEKYAFLGQCGDEQVPISDITSFIKVCVNGSKNGNDVQFYLRVMCFMLRLMMVQINFASHLFQRLIKTKKQKIEHSTVKDSKIILV